MISRLATHFAIPETSVRNTIKLLDEGNTLPFLARYRKEATGGLTDEQLFLFEKELVRLRKLEEAKLKAVEKLKEIGREELLQNLMDCQLLQEVNDLMAPFRTKRKTKASVARDAGLQPQADIILGRSQGKVMMDKLDMALHIVAEESVAPPQAKRIAENFMRKSPIRVKVKDEQYAHLSELNKVPANLRPHQIHSLFRAENENGISLNFDVDPNKVTQSIIKHKLHKSPHPELYRKGLDDGVRRLLLKRAENSIRTELKAFADQRALEVFKSNLKNLLITPPIDPVTLIAIDPGFKTGCKVAVIREDGDVLATTTIYPTPPHNKVAESKKVIISLAENHDAKFVVIGNGTASAETVAFVKETGIDFAVVPETGASVYSASKVAREEFPDLEVEIRGAVNIGRRVLDPLSEYVKIDPKALGVGQYQHDINEKDLDEALKFTMESAVNSIGIWLETASKEALKFIAGISPSVAKNIIEYRETKGFDSLEKLLDVPRLGKTTYQQCVGFLRLRNSSELLDRTLIHPEDYDLAKNILTKIGHTPQSWAKLNIRKRRNAINSQGLTDVQKEIIDELILFGQDPRGRKKIAKIWGQVESIESVKEGMVLRGNVTNVTDFGAFIDIGIKYNGLIHRSKLSKNYIKDIYSFIKIGQQVEVKVISTDVERKRISLELLNIG